MADLINGLGGVAGFGENVLAVDPANDDNSTAAINVTSVFANGLSIFGLSSPGVVPLKQIFVNNNGNVSFTQAFPNNTPFSMGGLGAPVFAPFWADVDTSGGASAATPGGNSTGSNRVYYDLDAVNQTLTVTWDDVGYWDSHTDPKNAFQLQIVGVGNGDFDLIYRYESINWTSRDGNGGSNGLGGLPARAGFSLFFGVSVELPASNDQDALLALDETVGNTGEAGVYKYSFRSGTLDDLNPNTPFVNDTVTGTAGDDVLGDPGGNDTFNGLAGNDLLVAGGGTDTYNGGAGIDTISYEALAVFVTVNLALTAVQATGVGGHTITNVENLIGSGFNDTLTGNASANTILGRAGVDTLNGGGGNDTLMGEADVDTLNGQAGDDTLGGGAGNDILNGGDGDDTLMGEADADTLNGGAGNDTLVGGAGNDTLNGDADTDTASYAGNAAAVTVNLALATAQNTVGAGTDTLTSIENLTGTGFNDTLIGNEGANVLAGGEGNDTLQGAGGNDVLEGGLGTDTLTGGEGSDTFRYTANHLTGADTVNGGSGSDEVRVTTLAVLTDSRFTGMLSVETLALAADLPGQSISLGSNSENAGISAINLAAIAEAANGVTVNLLDRSFGVNVTGGAGNDVIQAPISSVDGIDNYFGGGGDDAFHLSTLSSIDTLVGGANTAVGDRIVLRTTADISDDAFGGVFGVERLVLSDQVAAQSVQLGIQSQNGIQVLDASSATNVVNVDASARTDAITILGGSSDDFITAGGGANNIQGGDGDDVFVFTNAAFNLAPTVDGGDHVEDGGDEIRISDRAQISDAAFQNIANVEELHLTYGGAQIQSVELGANSEDAGIALLDVSLGSSTTVDLADRFDHISVVGGSGSETFVFSSASFGSGHTIFGGGGDDRIVIENAANIGDDAFQDVSGVGTLELSATGSAQSVTLEGDAEAAGINVVDGTALTSALTVTVADRVSPISISGGSGADSFRFTGESFSFAPTVNGGAGTDELRFTDGVSLSDDDFGSLDSVERVALSDSALSSQSVSLGENSESAGIEEVDASGVAGDDITIDASDRDQGITIRGGQSSNGLFGGSGGDTFYAGGESVSTEMAGGDGNDAYHVFRSEDQHEVIESSDGGVDTVFVDSGQDYNLSDDEFVENMVFTVTAANGGSGNSLNNQLTANAGNNHLVGMDGDDVLSGEAGNDTLWGGNDDGSLEDFDGNDLLQGGSGDDDMWGGTGDDTLEGGADADDLWGGVDEPEDPEAMDGNDILRGGAGTDRMWGGTGEDTLDGGTEDDDLWGGDGSDTLDGGGGADDMRGGDGHDIYFVDNANDVVREDAGPGSGAADTVHAAVSYGLTGLAAGVENLTLVQGAAAALNATGNALANAITGNEFGNLIFGGEGDDELDGGAGTDAAVFMGNRTDYLVMLAGDSVTVISAAEGQDTLTNIENLRFADGVMQIGSGGDDTYFSFPNTVQVPVEFFFGGNGTDTLSYVNAGGAVTVSLAIAGVQQTGGGGTDVLDSLENLTGSNFNDTLTGDGGSNVLDGGAGNDNLAGGLGNDTYIVGTAGDTVSEAQDGGTDLVRSTVSYALGTNVENLRLLGTAAINGAGNALDNVLTGNSGNNTLNGGGGNDTASYADAVARVTVNLGLTGAQATGGAGTDTLLSIEHLVGSAFNDVLTGNAGNNTLAGVAGDDTITGGTGNDVLDGGSGNDTASYAGAASGVAVDLSTPDAQATGGGGNDTLVDIENLTGTSLNDTLAGNGVGNVLNGGAGDDVLDGRGGADTMIGGAGNDTYNVDSTLDVVTEAAAAGTDLVRSSVDWALAANFENLTLLGSGNINATGNSVNNVLEGNSGNNRLDGGLGIDTASYASAAGGVTVSLAAGPQDTGAGTDTLVSIENLTGSAGNDFLTGNDSNNTLSGGAGNDTLNGGIGGDTMAGGAGDDTYVVNVATVIVTEAAGAGVDLVQSNVSHTLALNVENLTLLGLGNISGTGNTLNNILTGNTGNNILNGDLGIDTVSYANAVGAVTVNLAQATAQNTGSMGTDTLSAIENLTGGTGNDTLTGNIGNNDLDGGTGNDTLAGGLGNDTYGVDATLDVVTEAVNAGTDTVRASVSWSLTDHFENLLLAGNADINGTGNAVANVLTGNGGNNTLLGVAGNDTLEGGLGNDTLDGGDGVDIATYAGAASGVTVDLSTGAPQNTTAAGMDTLTAIENLTGSAFNDVLGGNSGANTLNGGNGTDTASYASAGGAVTVNLALTTAQNTGSMGSDTLVSMENLAGSAFNDTLIGNAGDNTVSGNSGNDTINGAAGNDTLNGNAGDDTLIGGVGNDTLDGGIDVDTASYAGATAAVTVSLALTGAQNTVGAGLDTLISIENLTGTAFNDTLTGDGGNNVLDGAVGNDLLTGGLGDDTLNGGAGIDTASYAGALAGVEVSLLLAGPQDTGAGSGSDTLIAIENLTGSAQNDTLTGDGGNNVLAGGAGDDLLDGGAGIDTLVGGGGDDLYFVNVAGDVVSEAANGGLDTVRSTAANYALAVNLEVLELAGAGNVNGTGNAANNILIGNTGNNILNGGLGIDTVSYANAVGAVTVNLAQATAQNTGSMGTDTLSAIENLTGGGGNDTLTGSASANVLDGGAGIDAMAGGASNDTYLVDHEDDAITEGLNAGTDLVLAITDFELQANVENLILSGDDNLSGTGNTIANVLTGNGGHNKLLGLGGNDTLVGGLGNDTLDGGDGTDTATYAAATAGVTVDLSIGDAQNTTAAGTDTLTAVENLIGSSFDDVLSGDGGANVLDGAVGNDVLTGGAGNDTLNGGAGIDTASYALAGAAVTVNIGLAAAQNTIGAGTDTLLAMENLAGSAHNDTLTGNAGANTVSGNAGNDTLNGGAGNDTLNGGAGNDTLVGGAGNDALNGDADTDTASYAGNAAGVVVSLAITTAQNTVGAGTDTLASIENLTGTGFNDTLTGDDGNNVLDGAASNDLLTGGLGDDTLNGGMGIDTASYAGALAGVEVSLLLAGPQDTGAGSDTLIAIENLTGSAQNDTLTGDGGNNVLAGGAGDDLLDGGAGIDTLVGGAGDDIYFVNVAGDVVAEAANGGLDTVRSTATSYTLAANVEFLELLGSGNISGTGNALNNVLAGNSGANTLNGGDGSDTVTYFAVSGPVTINLALAVAQNTTSAGMDTLMFIENVVGSAFDDTLRGNAAANLIDGSAGDDQMFGGAGNDTYEVDSENDVVTESANAGTDTVRSTVSYTLGDNQENLTLSGAENINATGNALANLLIGNGGDNIFDGGDGIDTVSYASSISDVEIDLSLAGEQDTVGAGHDTFASIENVAGSAFNDILGGTAGNNVINGGGGLDAVSYQAATTGVTINLALATAQNTLGAGTDTLISIEDVLGSAHNDTLLGTSGANLIDGMAGADVLRGLGGADQLTGGDGADTFDYDALTDSGITDLTRDVITDFDGASGDRIDLQTIDANAVLSGNQAFTFVGGDEFVNGNAAGKLRFDSINHILYGSTNADAAPEFSILLLDVDSLVAGNFIL